MEYKASKGSVGVESFQERLRLRLPRHLYNGKQKYLTLGMADNPENRKLAEAKAKQFESDIAFERFDPTLAKYKPQTHLTLVAPITEGQQQTTLIELWDKYTDYKSKTLSVTTINKDYKKTKNHIANDKTGQWLFLTFPSWEEARQAVNAARSEGKAAVFYDGTTLPEPPELPMPPEPPQVYLT